MNCSADRLFLHEFQQRHNVTLVKLALYHDSVVLLSILEMILTENLLH